MSDNPCPAWSDGVHCFVAVVADANGKLWAPERLREVNAKVCLCGKIVKAVSW